jgi:parallel beta-helix repeat protein
MLPAYTSHDVIYIVNDTDFRWQAGNESWLGDGSANQPYIIQGYNITNDTTTCIQIRDVSVYFEIRDCLITSTSQQVIDGIALNNVSHCHLEDCIISLKQVGFYATHSNGVSAINCKIDNTTHGAFINNSNHTSFVRCYFTNSTTASGLSLQDSHWAYVSDCHFKDNQIFGFSSSFSEHLNFTGNIAANNTEGVGGYSSHYGTYQSNTVSDNSLDGIYVDASEFCTVKNNIVHDNTERGINIHESNNTVVSHNIVYDNYHYGLFLWDSNRTLVYYNDIGWNPVNAHEQMILPCINYWDNGVVGNWWSDYSGTGPYTISGATSPQDLYPSNSISFLFADDVQYELGSVGNNLVLIAQALNPWYYEVCTDTEVIGTEGWNGGIIYANIDGLDVGVYNVTSRVFHISGHMASQSAIVTVVDTIAPEWVTSPTDQTLAYNESLSYEIQVTDFSGIDEWIVNDTQHFSIVDGVITNSTALEIGNYGLNITVVDIYGNARSAIITIRVLPISEPTDDLIVLFLIIGGAVVVIAVLVIMMKRKSG